MQTTTIHPWRPVAFLIGAGLAVLGCYGVYEYALKLEGGQVTYLVIAAPVVALTAAIIPPMAEDQWRRGAVAKSLLLWVALVPVLVVVFYAAAERVHAAKAGQSAEVVALKAAATRAEGELQDARNALTKATPAEARANATPEAQCGPACRTAKQTAQAARERVSQAEQALVRAQSIAIAESPYKAPAWLLPAVLDIVAFLGIWVGLSGPWWTQTAVERPARQKRKGVKAAKPRVKRKMLVPANTNNVVPIQAS